MHLNRREEYVEYVERNVVMILYSAVMRRGLFYLFFSPFYNACVRVLPIRRHARFECSLVTSGRVYALKARTEAYLYTLARRPYTIVPINIGTFFLLLVRIRFFCAEVSRGDS